jgi:ABC-type branched-subunit amino acid transport system permease subunit
VTATEAILYVVLGLGPGAVYAALGLGLVLAYRGSGIINLAYGAMAMYPTYVYAELRSSGQLVLPGIPGTHLMAGEVGVAPALAIALIVAAALGLVTYGVVVRPLRGAAPLATVVGAVGIMVVLQAVVALRFGADPIAVGPLLPQRAVTLAGTTVPADRMYLVGLLVVVLIAAATVYRFTRFGLASRGATESEVAAELLGYSAVRLSAINWIVGAVLAALFGILLAPIAGLSPGGYTLLVVPALVAALAGRLVSTWVAVAAGLSLGVLQSEATRVTLPWEWLGPQTIRTVLPFVALVVVLMLLGTPVPPRGGARMARLPASPPPARPLAVAVAVFMVGAAATLALSGGYRTALIVTMIGAMLCLSLVILAGFAGQVSLAQMSFAGVGGFVLSGAATEWGLPFPIGAVVGALVASACGVVVGLPALRARGMTVAITTLGAALAVEELIFRNLSKGILSTNSVAPARLGGVNLAATARDGTPRAAFGLLVVSVLAATSFAVMRLRMSGLGRRMLAVRSNERAAAATRVNVGRTKLVAFGLSAFVAGLAGTLTGYHQGALSDQSFGISRSLVVLAVAYLGGIGSVAGALVGGLVIPGGLIATIAARLLHLGRYETLFAGLAVIGVALRNPEGVASTLRRAIATSPLARRREGTT